MSTWTNITNAAVAVGGIPSSSTVTALRDNPVALIEGANNAPVNQAAWHPYNKVVVGDSYDGLIYDFAVNGSVTTITTPDFEDGYEYKVTFSGLSYSSGLSYTLSADFIYADTGSTGTLFTFGPIDGPGYAMSGDVKYTNARVDHTKKIAFGAASWTTIGSDGEDIKIQAYSGKIARARFRWQGSSFDAGKMWLFRRRDYASA